LGSYTNLEIWVQNLDNKVEEILSGRLQIAVKTWIDKFLQNEVEDFQDFTPRQRSQSKSKVEGLEGQPLSSMRILTHEIRMKNQTMYLDPPLEDARSEWISQLYATLGMVCDLPRIQSSRYEISMKKEDDKTEITYRGLLTRLLDGSLQQAYQVIEQKLQEVGEYVSTWLKYQALWDLDPNAVYSRLEDDLSKWQQLLQEIKKARGTFDTSETSLSFGPMVIQYGKVQSTVNAKYDSWQKEILNKFGSILGHNIQTLYSTLNQSRATLEDQSLDTESTAEAVSFFTFVQDLNRKKPTWANMVDNFKHGQKLLERQRYQFPADWKQYDTIQGEWTALNDILKRKNEEIESQLEALKAKISQEDIAVENRITNFLSDWNKSKPVQGDTKPEVAKHTLSTFEKQITKLQNEFNQLRRAKEALDLDITSENRLSDVEEELKDLTNVWTELSKVWVSINELKDTPWSSVVPRKIRTSLDNLLTQLKDLSTRFKSYAAYEYVQTTLRGYLKVNVLVTELKSDALRERHWKSLFKQLRVDGKFILSEMALGHLWGLDLQKNENIVKDVILVAQGEMALEEFLKQVKECWQNYELDLVNYQNRCRLIRGWDDLFSKCNEHLNSLGAMKLSPYFKVFEEEALAWEEKLNRVNMLFDVWIDVQRQWVYLEGIFASSADIKHLLPTESNRFQNINSEFLAVMKKVYKAPYVLEVLNIAGIQRSLDRLADLLSKIQKALGEYLEKERASFPRFYFVGDEDLLEIIGNSKDVIKIQKHFKKMFAGISNIILDEDGLMIYGMASREGEVINFKRPISLKDNPKINEWLTSLEKEMRLTLADNLAEAISELLTFYSSPDGSDIEFNSKKYLDWIEKFPAQLIVLASQAIWTENVERALGQVKSKPNSLEQVNVKLQQILTFLADTVLQELPPIKRRKCEHLVTELVHQRDVVRALINKNVSSTTDFEWLYQMRFYFNPKNPNVLTQLSIKMANASFDYGYEYLGLSDKLVQTPLTDRCYLTLTQALELRLGGSPFGPAGTGKTESVKALGAQLGRFVLVFCCDENFDFQAMGRIFVGLCQVGAWGCFDEFNRLEERILSAVSQQVQTIQLALKEQQGSSKIEIELVEKKVTVQPETG